MPTKIEFDFPRGTSLVVSETLEEVKEAIGAAEPAEVPLVELTDQAGRPAIVNAKHIALIVNK